MKYILAAALALLFLIVLIIIIRDKKRKKKQLYRQLKRKIIAEMIPDAKDYPIVQADASDKILKEMTDRSGEYAAKVEASLAAKALNYDKRLYTRYQTPECFLVAFGHYEFFILSVRNPDTLKLQPDYEFLLHLTEDNVVQVDTHKRKVIFSMRDTDARFEIVVKPLRGKMSCQKEEKKQFDDFVEYFAGLVNEEEEEEAESEENEDASDYEEDEETV